MTNKLDFDYLNLLKEIINDGFVKGDRTGVGTKSIFGKEIRHKMSDGFPILTSKKMFTKGVIHELLWFLKGDTNIKYLVDNGVNIWVGDAYKKYVHLCSANDSIWNKWMRKNPDETLSMFTEEEFIEQIKTNQDFANQWGELGPIYGSQWTKWGKSDLIWEESSEKNGVMFAKINPGINQIEELVYILRNNPDSRRLLVNAWNPTDLPKMTLPPCHYGFECWTRELTEEEREDIALKTVDKHELLTNDFILDSMNIPKRLLSLKWIQRSVDTALGLPYNIACYGFLLELLAQQCNMLPGELIGSLGDTHIYNNQFDGVQEQLKNETFELPTLKLKKASSIFDYKFEDFEIVNYKSAGKVNYPLSN